MSWRAGLAEPPSPLGRAEQVRRAGVRTNMLVVSPCRGRRSRSPGVVAGIATESASARLRPRRTVWLDRRHERRCRRGRHRTSGRRRRRVRPRCRTERPPSPGDDVRRTCSIGSATRPPSTRPPVHPTTHPHIQEMKVSDWHPARPRSRRAISTATAPALTSPASLGDRQGVSARARGRSAINFTISHPLALSTRGRRSKPDALRPACRTCSMRSRALERTRPVSSIRARR
jgi:hypothetical protein